MSFKAKKEATKVPEAPPASVTESKKTTDSSITYRLVVSFISKGAGPDHTRQDALMKYIESHPKKPEYKIVRWGREGESDFCFTLSELTTKAETVSFIDNVKKIAAGSDMMQIAENVEQQHKGR